MTLPFRKHFQNRRNTTRAAVALLLLATPGFGFIVFDPTVVANVIKEIAQSVKIYTTAKNTLSTMQANITHFSVKAMWQTFSNSVMAASVRNSNGETAGWNMALNNNSPAAASTAWNMANVHVNPGTVMAGEVAGSSPYLSSLAMIEAFDSSSPDCLNAVGQYRAQRSTNAAAERALEGNQLDGSAATNSEVEQLNLLNASDAQQMNEIKSQGQLHACLAEQTTISNMMQRNAAAAAINDAAVAAQEHSTNNTNFANESNSWQNDLP
jgi:type IV secretion system protein TrbJ